MYVSMHACDVRHTQMPASSLVVHARVSNMGQCSVRVHARICRHLSANKQHASDAWLCHAEKAHGSRYVLLLPMRYTYIYIIDGRGWSMKAVGSVRVGVMRAGTESSAALVTYRVVAKSNESSESACADNELDLAGIC